MYFFGVRDPGFFGAVNISTGESILFVPKLPTEYATWSGKIWTCDDFKNYYRVDTVRYTNEVCVSFYFFYED